MTRALLAAALAAVVALPARGETTDDGESAREAAMFGEADAGEPDTAETDTAETDTAETDTAETDTEQAAREVDLFGEPDGEPAPADGAATGSNDDRADALFGDDGDGDAWETGDIADRLAEADDRLALGARLYLRLDWSAPEEGIPEQFEWRTPGLLDVYLDGRPTDRIRAFIQGRLSHDFTVTPDSVDAFGEPVVQTRALLDQLWLKFDIARTLFVTVGRQPLRWGAGRFWTPTDFLNQQFRDPLAIFDERLGITLLKLHLPIESLGWNLYAAANLENARAPEDVGGALRAEFLFGTTEVAATVAARRQDPLRLGLDVSTGVWVFDLRGAVSLVHGERTPYWEGTFDFDPETFSLPEEVDRSDEWIPRASVGAEVGFNYTDEDAAYVGVEFFYNGFGYTDTGLYPWLVLQGQYVPFYLGELYGSVYALLPGPGRWDEATFVLSTLANLSDRSIVSRLDFSVQVLTRMSFNAYVAGHYGRIGELRFGIEVPPWPGIEGLEDGLKVAPPLVDIGFGLTTTF